MIVSEGIDGRPDGDFLFDQGNECTDGEYMQVDCNGCSCMGGRWACTLMACKPKDYQRPKENSPSKQE